MSRHVVWVPAPHLSFLGPLPPGFEAAAIPGDPKADPDLPAVEFLAVRPFDDLRPLYPQMTSLAVVQCASVGVDTQVEGVPPSLTLCSGKGTGRDVDVAEWAVAAVLGAQRDLPHFRDEQLARRWSPSDSLRLQGSTVLLLGYGSIARIIEERLAAFDVRLIRVARHARPGVESIDELSTVLGAADVVILTAALTEETRGLVDTNFLQTMKEGALLVNLARGPLVETDALVTALCSGRVRAVLDVTDPEPLPANHPLYDAPNVFITPHIAGTTKLAHLEMCALITEQICRYANGDELLNVVTGEY
jgi:phosphoglycerate dehydrogenase-like enzyme